MTTHGPHMQEQSNCPARADTIDRCPARAHPAAWVPLGGAACAARIPTCPTPPAHTHITSAQGKGARRTADGTADGERTREHLEAKKMPKKMKPNRVYMPAECGGVTTPPLLSNALRLQTARGKSALVASVAPGRCWCDRVRLMHDWAGSGRKGAGSRAQVGRGMAGWDGLGSAPQKLDLQMPI